MAVEGVTLFVGRAGSIRRAARTLGVSHSTALRRLAALERRGGHRRGARGAARALTRAVRDLGGTTRGAPATLRGGIARRGTPWNRAVAAPAARARRGMQVALPVAMPLPAAGPFQGRLRLLKYALLGFVALCLLGWLLGAWADARRRREEEAQVEALRARDEAKLALIRSRWEPMLAEARAELRKGAFGEARRLAVDLGRIRPDDPAVRDVLALTDEPRTRLMKAARLACDGRLVEVARLDPATWPAEVPEVVAPPRSNVARALLDARDWWSELARGLEAEATADAADEAARAQEERCRELDELLATSRIVTFDVRERLPEAQHPNAYLVLMGTRPAIVQRTAAEAYASRGPATLRVMPTPAPIRGPEVEQWVEVPAQLAANEETCRADLPRIAAAREELARGKEVKAAVLAERAAALSRMCQQPESTAAVNASPGSQGAAAGPEEPGVGAASGPAAR